MSVYVDIDFENYKLFIDGVQVNKTPDIVKPRETNRKSKHPVVIKIVLEQIYSNNNNLNVKELLYRMDNVLVYDRLREVQIYGDDPLMHFNEVVQILDHFFKTKCHLTIITKGIHLTNDIISVLNSYEANVCISHDGPAQTKLWNVDPLEKNKDIIKNIKSLSIACCLTKDNFDLCEINDWFYDKFQHLGVKLNNILINYNIVEVVDESSEKLAITDLAKFQLCLRMFFERCRSKDSRIIWNTLYHDASDRSVFSLCNSIVNSNPIYDCTNCCLEFEEVIIIDNNGYIRECEHLDDTYKLGVLEDLPNKMYEKEESCKKCKFRNLCKGACPLIPKRYFNINCAMSIAYYEVVADFGLKIIEKEVLDIANKHKYS